jgi:hypothetical protein
MDKHELEQLLIKVIGKKGDEGYRKLEPHELRRSKASPDPKKVQVADKLYPAPRLNWDDPREGREYKRYGEIIEVEGGKGASGSIFHQFLENAVGSFFLNTEERVVTEHGNIIISGTVDAEPDEDNIIDWKTVNDGVLHSIARGPRENTYTLMKKLSSLIQGNDYAASKGKDRFFIVYFSRDNIGKFLIREYEVDWELYWKNVEKCQDIIKLVDENCIPDCDGGVQLCDLSQYRKKELVHYCRHHRDYVGYDKSPVNCPGRLELAERQKNRKLDDDYEKQDVRADMDALMGE